MRYGLDVSHTRGKILVTTGTSSFSGWAAFIGMMPTIWYPETMYHIDDILKARAIETDVHGQLPDSAAN